MLFLFQTPSPCERRASWDGGGQQTRVPHGICHSKPEHAWWRAWHGGGASHGGAGVRGRVDRGGAHQPDHSLIFKMFKIKWENKDTKPTTTSKTKTGLDLICSQCKNTQHVPFPPPSSFLFPQSVPSKRPSECVYVLLCLIEVRTSVSKATEGNLTSVYTLSHFFSRRSHLRFLYFKSF